MKSTIKKFLFMLTLVTLLFAMPATVYAKPKINKKKIELVVGEKTKLKISGTKKKVRWSSSKNKVAIVNKKGVVTAKKKGKATITAKVGNKKIKCKVVVKDKKTVDNFKYSVSYHSAPTDYGVVIIAKNNYPYTVRLETDCVYYKNSIMVRKGTCDSVYLEPGRECALQAWVYDTTWDSYKIHMNVEKAEDIITNASNIVVSSNFGDDYNVLASVRNNGKKVSYTNIAVVYYQNGRIVGYDNAYADVDNLGSVDYIELHHPYNRYYEDIYTDSYKIYVNYSYAHDWSY